MINKRILIYNRMIWKKGLLVLRRFFIVLIVTGLVLASIAWLLMHADRDAPVLPGVDVAIVNEGGSFSITMGTRMVQGMESVKSICRFHEVPEEEALEGLKAGRYQAAAYLPPDLYDNVNHGVNTPVRILISSESLLALQMFRDLVDSGGSIIQIGESAIYAIYDMAAEYTTNGSEDALTDKIAVDFMTQGLQRNAGFETTVVSPYGEISIPVFYTVTILLAVLCIFFGLGFAELYKGENVSFHRCLRRTGIGEPVQGLSRILIITIVLFVFLGLCCAVLAGTGFLVEGSFSSFLFLPGLAFSAAAFIHMVYSCTSEETGSLYFLLISLVIFVVGGGLFPASMLPELLSGVPAFLPVRIWQKLLSEILMGKVLFSTFLGVLLYGAAMALAGILAAKIRKQ